MNNRLEMGVDKCRDMLSGGVIGQSNGAPRVVGFMDFGEEVEIGGVSIGDI